MSKLALMAALFISATVAGSSAIGQASADSQAYNNSLDESDIPLQRQLYEPLVHQMLDGGIDVLYKDLLDRDQTAETAIPGIHSAMITEAKAAGMKAVEEEASSAIADARIAMHQALTAKEIDRLADLYAPFIKQNLGKKLVFQSDDVSASAAVDRWTSGLTGGSEFDDRSRQISQEPGMANALSKASPIIDAYQKRLTAGFLIAFKTAIVSAKIKANELASAKGFAPPYLGASRL